MSLPSASCFILLFGVLPLGVLSVGPPIPGHLRAPAASRDELSSALLVPGDVSNVLSNGYVLGAISKAAKAAGEEDDFERLDLVEAAASAWKMLQGARKGGPHRSSFNSSGGPESLARERNVSKAEEKGWWPLIVGRVRAACDSASGSEWTFLGILCLLLLKVDVLVLQQLPETQRTHVVLLVLWLLTGATVCMEVFCRLGLAAGVDWATGYLMEIVFSVDSIFVKLLLFASLEMPRRLLSKAMLLGLLASVCLRVALFMGLASLLGSLKLLPFALGGALLYCGLTNLIVREDDASADVTQSSIVRVLRPVLGERLCEFYDEDAEALFVMSKGKACVTLLGVAVACEVLADAALSLDVVLAKDTEMPNAYLNLGSSILGLFVVRALFFVARDIFCRLSLTRVGASLVLIFVGGELLLTPAVRVSALASFAAVLGIVMSAAAGVLIMPARWAKSVT